MIGWGSSRRSAWPDHRRPPGGDVYTTVESDSPDVRPRSGQQRDHATRVTPSRRSATPRRPSEQTRLPLAAPGTRDRHGLADLDPKDGEPERGFQEVYRRPGILPGRLAALRELRYQRLELRGKVFDLVRGATDLDVYGHGRCRP